MYLVKNKFEIGEECYTFYKQHIHYKCPICEGQGSFMHNGYKVQCRNCNGTGKLHNAHQHVLAVCKVKISSIKALFNGNDVSIKYKVNAVECSCGVNNRSESHLFKTAEEAEKYCIEQNSMSNVDKQVK